MTTAAGRFSPVPIVQVSGFDVASGPGGVNTLLAVDGLSVTWGREELLDQPDPGGAHLVLFDPSRTWATSVDRRGAPVTIRYSGVDEAGVTRSAVFFRGRIGGSPIVTPKTVRDPITGQVVHGSLVELELLGRPVDFGNITPTSNWPEETLGQRFDRVVAHVQNRANLLQSGGVMRPFWRDPKVAPVAPKDQRTILDWLYAVFDSCGQDRMTYQPGPDSIVYLVRKDFGAFRGLASLDWQPNAGPDLSRYRQGAYIATTSNLVPAGVNGGAAGALYLDGAELEYDAGSAGITVPEKISTVVLNHQDSLSTPTTWADRTVELAVAGVSEVLTGVRTASVDSLVGWNSYADVAASDLARLVREEGSTWVPTDALRFTTRKSGGFASVDQAAHLLAGHETNAVFFLQRSFVSHYEVRPIYGVMGGTIAYEREGWDLELVASPIVTYWPQHSISWEEIDAGTAPYELQWWDEDHQRGLHDSVTCEDLAFVSTGLGVSTIPATQGWDRIY